MYLMVVNNNNSKIEIEEEAKLIWTSLLLADKVVVAGLSTPLFDWEFCMNKLPFSKELFELMEKIIPDLYSNTEDAMKGFRFYRKAFFELNSIKHKNHNQTLLYMTTIRALNEFKKEMLRWSKSYAEKIKFKELLPYSAKDKNTIDVRYLPFENTQKVKEIGKFISIDGYILTVKKDWITDVPSVNIEEAKPDDFQLGKLSFIYSEIVDLPFLIDIPHEHFNIVRENFLEGSKAFRALLAELKVRSSRAVYAGENFDGIKKTIYALKEYAAVYKKIESENLLLKELQASGEIKNRMKISAAFTSYGNFISLLEKQNIIESRENLYVRAEVGRYKHLEGICLFLIAEELQK